MCACYPCDVTHSESMCPADSRVMEEREGERSADEKEGRVGHVWDFLSAEHRLG